MKKEIRKTYKKKSILSVIFMSIIFLNSSIFATSDPLQVINNLSDVIFQFIQAIGGIMIGFGIVNIGMSFKSHDPTQKSNGLMALVGGIIIAFSKEILARIIG